AALGAHAGFVVHDATGAARLARQLVLVGLLLAIAAWLLWRRLPGALLLLELVALLPLQPLLMSDGVEWFRAPPWRARLGERRSVLILEHEDEEPGFEFRRRKAAELAITPGVQLGLQYPLASDVNGLQYRFNATLRHRLERDGWPLPWLRTTGV